MIIRVYKKLVDFPLTEPKQNHKTEEKNRKQSKLFSFMALNVSMQNIIKIF